MCSLRSELSFFPSDLLGTTTVTSPMNMSFSLVNTHAHAHKISLSLSPSLPPSLPPSLFVYLFFRRLLSLLCACSCLLFSADTARNEKQQLTESRSLSLTRMISRVVDGQELDANKITCMISCVCVCVCVLCGVRVCQVQMEMARKHAFGRSPYF